MNKYTKNNLRSLLLIIVVLVLGNLLGGVLYHRWDLTNDKRYTLSSSTLQVLQKVQSSVVVDVFLQGDLPHEFSRLQRETRQMLEEFALHNSHIKFQFLDPLNEPGQDQNQTLEELYSYGIKPLSLMVNDKGSQTQSIVLPWAIVSSGDKAAKVQLLKNSMGATSEQSVIESVQTLEYSLIRAINQVTSPEFKNIAVIKGNGELPDMEMADFLMDMSQKYNIASYTIDLENQSPVQALQGLDPFDLIIVAKPTQDFSNEQIAVLDQFIINGGKSLWLLDPVQAHMDSIRKNGSTLAFANKQSLGEMMFKYGVRLNPVLVKDEMGTSIKIASGSVGSQTIYNDFVWKFSPFVYPGSQHPIVKNLEGVKLDFTSPMDTLKNDIKKTVLLQSSIYSTTVGTPVEISLDVLQEKTTPEMYQGKGKYILAVLLEGEFTSVYANRVFPFSMENVKQKSPFNKMIVLSDGDMIRNQFDSKGIPLELGYDKWTNNYYGNKEFLSNSVDYLLQDNNLLSVRTKEVRMPMLDKMKIYENYSYIQILALTIPIVIVILFGIVFFVLRKSKLVKK